MADSPAPRQAIGNHWLRRPETSGSGHDSELEESWDALRSSETMFEADKLPVAKWEFLCWLADSKGLLLHGSGDPGIDLFEPRPPKDGSADDFSKQTAVFAASDGIWPIFYAILDRSRSGIRFLNAALRFRLGLELLTDTRYFFSVTSSHLAENPWHYGTVYLLPREGFCQQPPYRLGRSEVVEPHWASQQPVRPLARLTVGPGDFPFLDRVHGHDNEVIARRSAADPYGFPWLDR